METQQRTEKKDELLKQKIEWHKRQIHLARKQYDKLDSTNTN